MFWWSPSSEREPSVPSGFRSYARAYVLNRILHFATIGLIIWIVWPVFLFT